MRKAIALVLAVTAMLAASIAAASPPELAISANPPLSWVTGSAVAGTLGVGLAEHHALRLNAASYAYKPGASDLIGVVFFESDGAEGTFNGRLTDLSIGW